MRPRAVIVDTGRPSTGGIRRQASWRAILESAGAEVVSLDLMGVRGGRGMALAGAWPVLRGRAVPETLAWSHRAAASRLRELRPRCCVFLTLRAFDPALAALAPVAVLDYVDQLSANYDHRARIAGSAPRRAFYRLLSRAHARVEHLRFEVGWRTATSYVEAPGLCADWVPITALDTPRTTTAPDHDLVMVGNLSYLPNVSAVRWLDQLWPRLRAVRPTTTLLLAGRKPTDEVRTLAKRNGWTLVADFECMGAVFARGRVAVAPMQYATGNQIKVIDAASLAVPQLVTSVAIRGLHPDFPVTVADEPDGFIEAINALLDDPQRAADEASQALAFVRDWYSVDRWAKWARPLLDG